MTFWAGVGAIAGEYLANYTQGGFNSREAQKNRDWQEYMSNTAYTRAARDLQTAGLNRVIAMGNPASTPSGASSSVDKPNYSQAAINAASAKQAISLQKAEESLTKQKENESKSSESLNGAMALTQATQQALNTANSAAALENAKLIQEQARKVRLEADRSETWNPIYRGINDILEAVDGWLRSSSNKGEDGTIKKILDEIQTGDGAKRFWKDFTSKPEQPNTNVIQGQKWPKFKRGGK